MTLSGISIGFFIWFVSVWTFSYFQYAIWPVLSIVFCLGPDEHKAKLVVNQISEICLYVIYAAWAITGIVQLIQLLTNHFSLLIDLVGFIRVVPILGMYITAILAALVGGLYVLNYKRGVVANGGHAPLITPV